MRTTLHGALVAVVWACLVPGTRDVDPERAAPPAPAPIRGVTISTHTSGREWGTDAIASTLDDLHALGANWIATHPYARVERDGTVRHRGTGDAPPPHWTRPIAEAHARGMRVLIKPHLAYWGSGFAWRGAIRFETDAEWERFWTGYRAWIVDLARGCHDADALAVGTELTQTERFESEWRALIAAVRAVSPVTLVYAANWDAYDQVPFWDALDWIGIQAYFPVASSAPPTAAEVAAGWQDRMQTLRAFADLHERPIVFTELGYNRSFAAAVRPWEHQSDGEAAAGVQALCLGAALAAIEREDAVLGAFLWKWFPNPQPAGRNFQLATPAIERTIRGIWTAPSAAAAPASR